MGYDEMMELSDKEKVDFLAGCESWDEPNVDKCFEYLCEKYDVSMKDELGEWKGAESLLEELKKEVQ